MCDAEFLADTGLLVPFTAEMDTTATDSSEIVETVVVKPPQSLGLDILPTLRDKAHLITESFVHELTQSIENALYCRSLQVVVRKERGICSIVYSIYNNAANVDA